jgi:ATP-dependent helicase/nuclease subunit A
MPARSEPRLPFEDAPAESPPADHDARAYAVDPARNVVLEASAGTGKTRVLVERYVNLLRAGVDPDHILAITFTRKAAAEMRERIIARLREASRLSQLDLARWRDLKEHLGDIAISTIDAFCLSLLREYPLEADVDPGFELADDTEASRLVAESLDQALRICRAAARHDQDVALVFAQLGERRLRVGLTALLQRRLVAPHALRRFLERGPRDLTPAIACRRSAERLREAFEGASGGVPGFLADGPRHHPQFAMLAADIRALVSPGSLEALALDTSRGQAAFRGLVDRLRAYFLTQDGRPRERAFAGTGFTAEHCDSAEGWRRHRQAAGELSPSIAEAIRSFRRDLNAVLSRGVWRIFAVTLSQYQRSLDTHGLLDFSGVLERAVQMLKGMGEFAQSRYRLEARYRHVLVDEFQDTSRAQWELVACLVRSWGEGFGAAADALPPSIFIVGDRKQSIYGFRDADVTVLDEAAGFIEQLRAAGTPRRAIAVSFRAAPTILAFVNEVFNDIDKAEGRADAFRYGDADRFPNATAVENGERAVGVIAADSVVATAERVASEIVKLLGVSTVRDRTTGIARAARAGDAAILFRSRESHREFERALERQGVPTYVYKGLGFFDAPEVQDALALLRWLADPLSNIRAAALLRTRLVRMSDAGVQRIAPAIASAVLEGGRTRSDAAARLDREDREALARLSAAAPRWLARVDRLTPSELLAAVLAETAYEQELRGIGCRQAHENLKKLRAMIRRFQNRGYATLARVADHLEQLAVGDESNAAIDATNAVSLMTVHAAKGLEFPVVFLVNMGRGTGGVRAPIRVADVGGEAAVAIADYQSEADEDAQARDREESKRLLYVALTRARDRLYLSATVHDGMCRMGRGSLGEILPARFRNLFVEASRREGGMMMWPDIEAQG